MCKTVTLKYNTFQEAKTTAAPEKLVRSLYYKKTSVILKGLGFLCTAKIVCKKVCITYHRSGDLIIK